MTSDTEDLTVGQLVAENPKLLRVFESLGIDYCCGGDLSLGQASDAAGHDQSRVEAILSEALADTTTDEPTADTAWTQLDLMGLVDHIEQTHHQYLTTELPRLAELADKVVNAHGEGHPELLEVRRVLSAIIADMAPHLMKEERILFPIVRQIASATEPTQFHCGSVGNPIRVMRHEHDQVGEMLASLRRITDGYAKPDDACASFEAFYDGLLGFESDTHLHIHKENNVLFPTAVDAEVRMNQIASM